METTIEKIINSVKDGAHCSVDFKNKSISIDGKAIDLTSFPSGIEHFDDLDDWLDKVEELYDAYKYSTPTKDTINKNRRIRFKALSVKELFAETGRNALHNPTIRNVALAELESFIVLSLVDGSFSPEELFNKDWFYQGQDKSFIMRKDWF